MTERNQVPRSVVSTAQVRERVTCSPGDPYLSP
jgi:hypothetical protein